MSVEMKILSGREEWKPVVGFELEYQVSSFGRIKGIQGTILKPYKMPNGYLQVTLYKDNTKSKKYVHRLVAEAFCSTTEGRREVNHIDENKENNAASNLEWVSRAANMRHGTRGARQSETLALNGKMLKSVDCYSANGKFLQTFGSIREAAEKTGASATAISLCCKNKVNYKTAGGFVWKYHKGGEVDAG